MKKRKRNLLAKKKLWTNCEVCGKTYLDLGIGPTCNICLKSMRIESKDIFDCDIDNVLEKNTMALKDYLKTSDDV